MTETPDGTDDTETLAGAFWTLARQFRNAARESLQRWDITPSQARAMQVLMRHRTLRLSDLSEHLHIAARSTTEVVDGLQAKGLVERQPDPNDRRATLVTLTEAGQAIGESIRAARGNEAAQVFDRLSAADQADLARILRKLRD